MKMAVRMPDAMKIERDEIDENDWAQIKVVIEEGLNNIMTFRKDERSIVRKRISIAYWEYSTVHD
jgi:anti-sigma regulatory factor (Ser/Thr protein kinase)